MAAPTAGEVLVGEVVANGLWNDSPTGFVFTVRVDQVLRGPARVGDLREFIWFEPNWPWMKSPGEKPYPACGNLYGSVGETVILALGARTPGGTMRDAGQTWYQPPTTFHTIGVVEGSGYAAGAPGDREALSLDRLRQLVALSVPPTDASPAEVMSSSEAIDQRAPYIMVYAAAFVLGALWHGRSTRRDEHQPAR